MTGLALRASPSDFSTKPPSKKWIRIALLTFGITRADLYDAFLFKSHEVESIVSFHQKLAHEQRALKQISVLDVGCGTGRLLTPFAKQNWKVRGIEPDADYFARAVERVHSGNFSTKIEVTKSALANCRSWSRYDLLTAVNGILYYCRSKSALLSNLSAAWNLLAAGGIAVFDLADFDSLLTHAVKSMYAETSIQGARIVRNSFPHINAKTREIHHFDHYHVERGSLQQSWWECWRFKMWSAEQLSQYMREVGFKDIRIFDSWGPQGTSSQVRRLIVIGRKRKKGESFKSAY